MKERLELEEEVKILHLLLEDPMTPADHWGFKLINELMVLRDLLDAEIKKNRLLIEIIKEAVDRK